MLQTRAPKNNNCLRDEVIMKNVLGSVKRPRVSWALGRRSEGCLLDWGTQRNVCWQWCRVQSGWSTRQFQHQWMTSDLRNAGERSAAKCKGNWLSLSGRAIIPVGSDRSLQHNSPPEHFITISAVLFSPLRTVAPSSHLHVSCSYSAALAVVVPLRLRLLPLPDVFCTPAYVIADIIITELLPLKFLRSRKWTTCCVPYWLGVLGGIFDLLLTTLCSMTRSVLKG